jgi:hypothetical protein
MGFAVHNLTIPHGTLAAVAILKSERERGRHLTGRPGTLAAVATVESVREPSSTPVGEV